MVTAACNSPTSHDGKSPVTIDRDGQEVDTVALEQKYLVTPEDGGALPLVCSCADDRLIGAVTICLSAHTETQIAERAHAALGTEQAKQHPRRPCASAPRITPWPRPSRPRRHRI